MVKGFFIAIDKSFGWNSRLWYKTTAGLVAPSDRMYITKPPSSQGIDVPEADVAIIVGGTQGEREHVQRIGRLLRPSTGKRAIVYELVTLATSEGKRASERRRGLAAAHARSA